MSELKNCPFCGTESVSFMPELFATQQIYCKFCETSIIFGGTIEWDTKRFNSRPIEDAQVAEIEALKATVAELEADNARRREVFTLVLEAIEKALSEVDGMSGLIKVQYDIEQCLKGEG